MLRLLLLQVLSDPQRRDIYDIYGKEVWLLLCLSLNGRSTVSDKLALLRCS